MSKRVTRRTRLTGWALWRSDWRGTTWLVVNPPVGLVADVLRHSACDLRRVDRWSRRQVEV